MRLNFRETAIGVHRIEDFVGSIAGLDAVEKRNVSCLGRVSYHLSSIFQALAYLLYQLL